IVDPDAGAADHLQLPALFENFRRDLGGRADREAIELADQFGEPVLVGTELRLEIDLDAAILEDLHGGGGKSIRDENARRHGRLLISVCVRRPVWFSAPSAACAEAAPRRARPHSSARPSCRTIARSEERRVGKECRSRWWPDRLKKIVTNGRIDI